MSSSNNQPDALSMPFANNGDKSTIPSSATGTNKASLTEGFPQITSESIADGGIPPSREDFNALGNISTSHNYFMQNGGGYTFVPAVSTAIGGYPKGALLWYRPSTGNPQLLVSTKNNNTDNFNTNQSYIGTEGSGKSWEIVTVSGSNYVDLTSNQTVSGTKTYSSGLIVQGTTTTPFAHKRTNLQKGTPPSDNNVISRWRMTETSGVANVNSFGGMEVSYSTSGSIVSILQAFKPELNSTTYASISIAYPATGDPYTSAPTPATSDNSTKIATTAFVKAQSYITGITSSDVTTALGYTPANDSNVVKTSGTQTVGGAKTFTSDITISKSNPTLISKNTAITKGTVPTSGDTPTNNNTYAVVYRDSANNNIGALFFQYNTNKDVQTRIYAHKANASGDNADTYLRVYYNADGKYGVILSADNASSDTNESLTRNTTSVNDVTIPCMGWVNKVLNTSGRGLATFSKAANGYYKFTNGLIIQWGNINSSDSSITYPQPFTSATSYSITTTAIRSSGGTNWRGQVNTRTTTGCNIITDSASEWLWIAIGY